MKKIVLFILLAGVSCHVYAQKVNIGKQFSNAEKQVAYMLTLIDSGHTIGTTAEFVSPRTVENDKLKMVKGGDWTSGFFSGILWFLYGTTQKKEWLIKAQKFTALIENQKFNASHHDLGFMIYNSFGNGYRLTGDTNYRNVVIQAAKTLSKRFNSVTGVIKSWGSNSKWQYPVIIDNMMNLELLFEATRLSNDSSFYKIAVAHANTTIKNHFRPDFSSYHVIDYDTISGAVRKKNTAQGYSDSSSWARGQAWGLYGFTMCYRETKNDVYLKQAIAISDYILNRLPKNRIPYWDYDAPEIPNKPRDASAAVITASALYELASLSNNRSYHKIADKIMKELCSTKYLSPIRTSNGFILLHSTGHKPAKSEIDVPIIYADYYFLEALIRSNKWK